MVEYKSLDQSIVALQSLDEATVVATKLPDQTSFTVIIGSD